MIDSLYYSSRGGVKTLLWITKSITKSFIIHYERFEQTQLVRSNISLKRNNKNQPLIFCNPTTSAFVIFCKSVSLIQ